MSDEPKVTFIEEREELVNEYQRLLACYQIATRDDKNVVWAALNKYIPLIGPV